MAEYLTLLTIKVYINNKILPNIDDGGLPEINNKHFAPLLFLIVLELNIHRCPKCAKLVLL